MRGTPKQSRVGWREWWPLAVAACFLLAFFVFLRALPHEQLPATGCLLHLLSPPSTTLMRHLFFFFFFHLLTVIVCVLQGLWSSRT